LYTKILENGGAVMSEYKPEEKTKLWAFPQRNRIVAGLSTLGVLVVEAGENSGSLITAEYARKFGKEVFSVPGPISSPTSRGTNLLIKDGATLVTSPDDILGRKSEGQKTKDPDKNLTGDEAKIYEALSQGELSIDELSVHIGIGVVSLMGTLSIMSLKGLITEVTGKYYANQ
jgi:DNA processing protein